MFLFVTLLLAAASVEPTPPAAASRPGHIVTVVVLGPDLLPIRNAALSIHNFPPDGASPSEPGPTQEFSLSNAAGQARLVLPAPGKYSLRVEANGFLPTTVGPFTVCPAARASCGPSLITPLKLVIPPAIFLD